MSASADAARFLVLGTLRVTRNGHALNLGGPKQRLVLAQLVASATRTVSIESLTEGLWGDQPPDTARKVLQVYVHRLRGSLAEEFPAEASGLLSEALALWTGEPYEDLEDSIALEAEIVRLSELRIGAHENRIDADLAAGSSRDLIGELDALSRDHPLRERITALRMLALYRVGRQTEALRALEETRQLLADEMGLEPSAELRALELQILNQDIALDAPGNGPGTVVRGPSSPMILASSAGSRSRPNSLRSLNTHT